MNNPVEVSAIEFRQKGIRIYLFGMAANKLAKLVKSRFRTSDDQDGIQRFLDKKRLAEIASYVSIADNAVPNNIIVNFTKDVQFSSTSVNGVVTIRFPDEEGYFGDVIDGQHRLYGITYPNSRYPDLELAVTGLMIEDPKIAGKIFADINSKQKPVSASLLVSLQSALGALPEIDSVAAAIMERLNNDSDSPLENKIMMFQDETGKNIRNDQVLKVLRILLQPDKTLYAFLKNLSTDTAVTILKSYLWAVAETFPDAWNNSRNYLLTRPAGLSVILGLFDRVFQRAREVGSDKLPTRIEFKKALEPIQDTRWDSTFFREERLTSAVGVTQYRNMLLDKLPPPGVKI